MEPNQSKRKQSFIFYPSTRSIMMQSYIFSSRLVVLYSVYRPLPFGRSRCCSLYGVLCMVSPGNKFRTPCVCRNRRESSSNYRSTPQEQYGVLLANRISSSSFLPPILLSCAALCCACAPPTCADLFILNRTEQAPNIVQTLCRDFWNFTLLLQPCGDWIVDSKAIGKVSHRCVSSGCDRARDRYCRVCRIRSTLFSFSEKNNTNYDRY